MKWRLPAAVAGVGILLAAGTAWAQTPPSQSDALTGLDTAQVYVQNHPNVDQQTALDDLAGARAYIQANPDTTTTTEVATSTTSSTTSSTSTSSTTTTVPPTTTTTLPPTTTTSTTLPTTTTPPSTTIPPTTTIPVGPGCGLAQPAFCDTFSSASPGATPRGGDLTEPWGVSRLNTGWRPGDWNDPIHSTALVAPCSTGAKFPDLDVRVCNGQMLESSNDNDTQTRFAFYPKQPFDFAGRTGTFTFDVSDDNQGTHGAWPEFGITDQPIPIPSGITSGGLTNNIRNGVWFSMSLDKCNNDPTMKGIDVGVKITNYVASDLNLQQNGCVRQAHAGQPLNHIELRISQQHIEVWGSDPGGVNLHRLVTVNNANLPITRGLVWVTDVHYNASKDGYPQHATDHTFAWDNVGFDGPKTYRDLSYDVPESKVDKGSGTMDVGWNVGGSLTKVLTVTGVHAVQPPTGALVTFSWMSYNGAPGFRVNSGPWHDNVNPFNDGVACWRSLGVTVPLAETHEGTNTIEFRNPAGSTAVANVNLILVAGAPA